MKNSYDQSKTEFIVTKKVSPFVKFTTIFLAIIFAFIPLAELLHELDYNYNKSETTFNSCIVGYEISPLQFKEMPTSY